MQVLRYSQAEGSQGGMALNLQLLETSTPQGLLCTGVGLHVTLESAFGPFKLEII